MVYFYIIVGARHVCTPTLGSVGVVLPAFNSSIFRCINHSIIDLGILVNLSQIEDWMNLTFIGIYFLSSGVQQNFNTTWDTIANLLLSRDEIVILGGNFNAILSQGDIRNYLGNPSVNLALQSFMYNNTLVEPPIIGPRFTWWRGTQPPRLAQLDRFLILSSTLSLFPRIQ